MEELMKKYTCNRKLDDIISIAESKGWEVDTQLFDTGSDYIYLRDLFGQVKDNDGIPRQIAYNTANGFFFVYEPLVDEPVATHLSEDLDNVDWYSPLLEMFYEGKEVD